MKSARFPSYGVAGVCVILLAEVYLFLGVTPVGVFFTPIVWTGYILLIDALTYRRRGASLISTRGREFVAMLIWSVCCWLVFEGYNLHLHNWEYTGLPDNLIVRTIGYVWSFATIFPAILETMEFIEPMFPLRQGIPNPVSPRLRAALVSLGSVCLGLPLLLSPETAFYLFALVWVGFSFLIDPLLYSIDGKSVLHQYEMGSYRRIYALAISGIVCGVLWEFWNYWSIAKWKYLLPASFAGPKIFEMPLLGYLGFIPFAFECYVLQELLVAMFPSLRPQRA